ESVGAGDPAGPPAHHLAVRAGLGDPVFFLLTFVAVTTSVAFISMVAVAIPTMLAMRRAANSFALLADAALDELPSTMTAVRLSGMEISDFTLELSDLRPSDSRWREQVNQYCSSSRRWNRTNEEYSSAED
uniref:Uncharacterized protein n=1 Tax=Aegilops tauschii subsp. strangulata TaxID=200361 RepID=A0A453B3V3_AEGTS